MGIGYEGGCASRWLWGLVAPGLGQLKPDIPPDRVTDFVPLLATRAHPSP